MAENNVRPNGPSNSSLIQPAKGEPILPKEWLHRYFKIRLTANNGQHSTVMPCSSSHLFIGDLNPRWYVDRLIETSGGALFILYLETTDACTDRCNMCFTTEMRRQRGFSASLDMSLALQRVKQLRERYSTFRSVCLVGPGEPLEYKSFTDICPAIADMGLSIRVYTSGKRLRDARIRKTLLNNLSLVRISLDAASSNTFQKIHGAKDFDARLESIKRLVEERQSTDSRLTIGLHFVIQEDNLGEIVDFVDLAKELHADFVVFTQSTFGKVLGLSEEERQQVPDALDEVRILHDEKLAVVVPRVVRRHTHFEFDSNYLASAEMLNACYNSRNKIYFGVQNDFAGCWLAALGPGWEHFYRQAYVGPLREDCVFHTICRIVDNGLGSFLDQGAYLACNSCLTRNYNTLAKKILEFSRGKSGIDTELIQYLPGSPDDDFEIVFGTAK